MSSYSSTRPSASSALPALLLGKERASADVVECVPRCSEVVLEGQRAERDAGSCSRDDQGSGHDDHDRRIPSGVIGSSRQIGDRLSRCPKIDSAVALALDYRRQSIYRGSIDAELSFDARLQMDRSNRWIRCRDRCQKDRRQDSNRPAGR